MTKTFSARTTTALGISASLLGAGTSGAASIDAAPGFFFSTLPFSDSGTTLGAQNDIGLLPGGISTYPTVAGPDVFYSFFVGSSGNMTFQVSVTGATGYDPAIYLLKDEPSAGRVVIGRDTGTGGASESFTTAVTAGSWYYFVVDSFYSAPSGALNRHAGAFSLNVSGTAQLGIPEPGSAGLLGAAAAVAAWRRRRTGLQR